MAEKKMDPAQARSFVHEEARKSEAWKLLDEFLSGVEQEFRTKEDTDASIAAMKRKQHDMKVVLENATREHQTALAGLVTKLRDAGDRDKRETAEMTRGMTQARQAHDGAMKAMAANEAEQVADFDATATKRRETLAALNKQIREAEGTIAALKAGLPG